MSATYILMAVVGLVLTGAGVVQFARGGRAARRTREAAAYRERLAGVMLVSLGLALLIFAITFAMTATPASA